MFASVSHVLTIEIESLKEWGEPHIECYALNDVDLFAWKFVIIKPPIDSVATVAIVLSVEKNSIYLRGEKKTAPTKARWARQSKGEGEKAMHKVERA